MNFDTLLNKYQTALHDIDENGVRTKSQKKEFISLVNRIIESFFEQGNALAQAEMFDTSETDRNAYFKVKWSLPSPVMMHQYESALKKYEKAAQEKPVFNYFTTELKKAAEYVAQGVAVKLMEPVQKKSSADVERESHKALWVSLPEASKETVEAIIAAVTEPVKERHEARKEYVLSTRTEILDELNGIESHRARHDRRNELVAKYGQGAFQLLISPLPEIEKSLEQERLDELLKIRYVSTKKLGGLDIDAATAVHVTSGFDGVECEFALLKSGDCVGSFGFKAIFAGGYNIQRLHTRTVFNLSLK